MLWNDIKSVLVGEDRQTEQAIPRREQLILETSSEMKFIVERDRVLERGEGLQ